MLLLSMIPLVNIILLFVWSFSSQTNKSKKSYARAVLILTAACAVLSAIAAVVCMVVFKINLSQFIPFFKA